VKRGGWEGLVAKDERSAYVGGRTRSGLKVKIRRETRFVVVGLDVPLAAACSLLLASRQDRRLVYVGRVEWGVSRTAVADIRGRCVPRTVPACRGAEAGRGVVWIQPTFVAEVTFSELMQGRLRDPVLRSIGPRSASTSSPMQR
jgi:bifunctional non-homologous end joining protein LigD